MRQTNNPRLIYFTQAKILMLKRLSVIVTIALLFSSSLTLAQSKDPQQADKFPPSPLEITTPDPLVPPLSEKRELTLEEQLRLQVALDELNQEALAKSQAGDRLGAFDIWHRELRLRRYLGVDAEVKALSRVGDIAWNQNNREEVGYITQRLQAIQKQVQSPKKTEQSNVGIEFWRSLGEAYQKVRSPKPAVEAYNQVLAIVRQQQDTSAEVETLKTIGELHLSWFNYPQAATTYEQLLSFATVKGDRLNEIAYLQQLAYIYQQGKQPQQSINTLNQLVKIYSQESDSTRLPELQIAIGSNYELLAQENSSLLQQAFNSYQQAYLIAWRSQQYARAAEALQKLIPLYRLQKQTDEALQASQLLLQTQELAVNYYGMMQAYDQRGQLYIERKDYPQALAAFQKGLELAQQLKHEEAYFTQQIEKLSKANF